MSDWSVVGPQCLDVLQGSLGHSIQFEESREWREGQGGGGDGILLSFLIFLISTNEGEGEEEAFMVFN